MRFLVTGGAGFIGSHLCDALIARGDSVIALDDLSTGRLDNLVQLSSNPNFTFVEGTILDQDLVDQLMAQVDGCFHLAAAVGVDLIVNQPIQSMITNIRGSDIVLHSALAHRVKTMVTSSSEIYGKNSSDAMKEDDDRLLGSPLNIRWTYSDAKVIEEALAHSLWLHNQLPTVIVRLFNTVGPRQTGQFGMVIPRFVASALANKPIEVYGSGSQSRVFCHVSDVINAMLLLWNDERAHGDVFNIGGIEEISVEALAHRVIDQTKSSSGLKKIPYSEAYGPGFEDMHRRVPSIVKVNELTGWTPQKTLDDVIADVAEFQSSSGRI